MSEVSVALRPMYEKYTRIVTGGNFKDKHTYITCAWKRDRLLTVWRGINTLTRNCLCSAFSGRAKPLIILEERAGGRRGDREEKNK